MIVTQLSKMCELVTAQVMFYLLAHARLTSMQKLFREDSPKTEIQ